VKSRGASLTALIVLQLLALSVAVWLDLRDLTEGLLRTFATFAICRREEDDLSRLACWFPVTQADKLPEGGRRFVTVGFP
jgi:hypothetical protein